MSHTAILLLAHGTPDKLSDMAAYLQKVTSGRPMPAHVIEELEHRYAEIGLRDEPLPEGPPLTRWTLRQVELLEAATGQKVYVGMRNWHPFIADTVAQMKTDGVAHARVLCLAPQNSRTSTGLYRKALDAALATTPGDPFTYDFIPGWSEEPLLAQAFAERLWPNWAEACATLSSQAGKPTRAPVLFTAHSVPCRTLRPTIPDPINAVATDELSSRPERSGVERPAVAPAQVTPPPADGIQDYGPADSGDPYPNECKSTAAAVAARLAPVGMTEADWFFAFQSQGIAGAPWIGPTVEDTMTALAAAGHKGVVIQPIGFLCDHVEILYDIDISFRKTAADLGLQLWRPQSLNDSPTLIQALDHVLYGDMALSRTPNPELTTTASK
jgi:protoporphyrin/coproporphyrin ferrochelatase